MRKPATVWKNNKAVQLVNVTAHPESVTLRAFEGWKINIEDSCI